MCRPRVRAAHLKRPLAPRRCRTCATAPSNLRGASASSPGDSLSGSRRTGDDSFRDVRSANGSSFRRRSFGSFGSTSSHVGSRPPTRRAANRACGRTRGCSRERPLRPARTCLLASPATACPRPPEAGGSVVGYAVVPLSSPNRIALTSHIGIQPVDGTGLDVGLRSCPEPSPHVSHRRCSRGVCLPKAFRNDPVSTYRSSPRSRRPSRTISST